MVARLPLLQQSSGEIGVIQPLRFYIVLIWTLLSVETCALTNETPIWSRTFTEYCTSGKYLRSSIAGSNTCLLQTAYTLIYQSLYWIDYFDKLIPILHRIAHKLTLEVQMEADSPVSVNSYRRPQEGENLMVQQSVCIKPKYLSMIGRTFRYIVRWTKRA